MKNVRFIVLILFSVSTSFAQNGLGLWTGISINKKITDKFSVDINGQSRATDNISYFQSYLGEVGISYKLLKNWELAGYYRYISKRKTESKIFKNRHRFYGDISFEKKLGKLKFENRVRYQHQFKDNDGEIGFDKSYLREKIELSFPNKSKFKPYLSGDLFYQIGGNIDQIRPKVGTSYKINKRNSLDASIFTNYNLLISESISPIISISYKLKL